MAKKRAYSYLKDVDDLMSLLTGKRIRDVVPRAVELFGDEIVSKLMRNGLNKPPADSPYAILEVRPDASDLVVKAVYRAKARIYHPDNKDTGNADEFRRITQAFEAIQAERKSD